jgi:hypothetical protein
MMLSHADLQFDIKRRFEDAKMTAKVRDKIETKQQFFKI